MALEREKKAMSDLEAEFNFLQDVPLPFALDVNTVVKMNYQLTLRAIAESESRSTANLQEQYEEPEVARAVIHSHENFHEGLRNAAHELAIVGLITRLEHWTGVYVSGKNKGVVANIDSLNNRLGAGPVSTDFFAKLVTVRDSVIHADSAVDWEYRNEPRQVAPEYRGLFDRVELTEADVLTAIDNAISQMNWYEQELEKYRSKKPARVE
jgi:hypothetical protein